MGSLGCPLGILVSRSSGQGEKPAFPSAKPAIDCVPKEVQKHKDIGERNKGISKGGNLRNYKIKFFSINLHKLRLTLLRFLGYINSREAEGEMIWISMDRHRAFVRCDWNQRRSTRFNSTEGKQNRIHGGYVLLVGKKHGFEKSFG